MRIAGCFPLSPVLGKSVLGMLMLGMLVFGMLASSAHATIDAFDFKTPAEEAQYRSLIDELRCPKCLNTNLSGSDSPIAADLRREVHRLVSAGKSDDEIRTYLVDRYGDFILYRPRLSPWSVALYALPGLLAMAGFIVIGVMVRRIRRRTTNVSISASEQARLTALLARHNDNVGLAPTAVASHNAVAAQPADQAGT